MVSEETILICIDNSKWMQLHEASYALQLRCARSYCRAKLKSNPKNAIAIVTLATSSNYLFQKWLSPTSDVDKILFCLETLKYAGLGGDLSYMKAVMIMNSRVSKANRMLLFARGPAEICKTTEEAESYGNYLKEKGVAVDVITFCRNEQHLWDWKKALDAFVAAANNGNNSHIKHIRPDPSTLVSHVLCGTPQLIPFALLDEEDNKKTKIPEWKLGRKEVW